MLIGIVGENKNARTMYELVLQVSDDLSGVKSVTVREDNSVLGVADIVGNNATLELDLSDYEDDVESLDLEIAVEDNAGNILVFNQSIELVDSESNTSQGGGVGGQDAQLGLILGISVPAVAIVLGFGLYKKKKNIQQ